MTRNIPPQDAPLGESLPAHPRSRSKTLIKQIFAASHPEQVVASLPAESLFLAIRQAGLGASTELLEIIPHSTLRLILDLDLWHRDAFNETNFLEWLAITDATQDIELLRTICHCVDLKILSLIIGRNVSIHFNEEPTELPPADGYYTPDKGYTWLQVTAEDGDAPFLINRLLATIFDTSPEVFYQLLAVAQATTPSIIEEEAYQDRCRRLSLEGFPDRETATALHQPLPPEELLLLLDDSEPRSQRAHTLSGTIPVVESFLWDNPLQDRLRVLVEALHDTAELAAALTFITNAAIEHFGTDIADPDAVATIIEQTHGVLSIGITLGETITSLEGKELFERVGLMPLYRLGLFKLFGISSLARKIPKSTLATIYESDRKAFVVLSGLRERVPLVPIWFAASDDKLSALEEGPADERIATKFRPLAVWSETALAETLIRAHLPHST